MNELARRASRMVTTPRHQRVTSESLLLDGHPVLQASRRRVTFDRSQLLSFSLRVRLR